MKDEEDEEDTDAATGGADDRLTGKSAVLKTTTRQVRRRASRGQRGSRLTPARAAQTRRDGVELVFERSCCVGVWVGRVGARGATAREKARGRWARTSASSSSWAPLFPFHSNPLSCANVQTVFLPIIGLVPSSELKPGDLVGTNKDSFLVIEKLPSEHDARVKTMELDEKPKEDYADIGGLDKQIRVRIAVHKGRLGVGFPCPVRSSPSFSSPPRVRRS